MIPHTTYKCRDQYYTILLTLSSTQPTGEIIYSDTPDVTVSMFTQAEISKGRISYKPPAGEIGIVPRVITVEFDVQDSSGNVEPGKEFGIIFYF